MQFKPIHDVWNFEKTRSFFKISENSLVINFKIKIKLISLNGRGINTSIFKERRRGKKINDEPSCWVTCHAYFISKMLGMLYDD